MLYKFSSISPSCSIERFDEIRNIYKVANIILDAVETVSEQLK